MGDRLEQGIDDIAAHLSARQRDLDAVIELSRRVIREAGQAITLLHNGRRGEAKAAISALRKQVAGLKSHDAEFRHVSLQAYQEYAEAVLFYHMTEKDATLGADEVGVGEEAYLLSLMDVVGELKREVIDKLREGRKDEAERRYEMMQRIYDTTRGLKFAESVLPGFRRKQDVARIQLESAGGELLHASH